MPANHLILCRPLRLLPSIFPSIRVFSNESVLRIRLLQYWNFSFSISSSNEYPGLNRMDWLDLLAVQGTLKSLLQHHSSKASIPQHSAFFIVQLSHPYMTTGEIIALTRWTFVGKVMSLLFNALSRLVITFLPRKKCLNFMAAVTICGDFELGCSIVSLTAFVIIITHNGLPQRILPLCLTVKFKCLCSESCLPVNGKKGQINISPCLRLAILGDTRKIKWPFTLFPHLPSSLSHKITSHPDPNKMLILTF